MITFIQKDFSCRDIARSLKGKLDKAVAHILKLMFKFNYKNDCKKHKEDIANAFLSDVFRQYNSNGRNKINRNRHKIKEVYNYYEELIGDSDKKQIDSLFRKNYNFTGKVTDEDFEQAMSHLKECISAGSSKEALEYLNHEFPG